MPMLSAQFPFADVNQEVWTTAGGKLSVTEKWGSWHADPNKKSPFRVFGEKEAPGAFHLTGRQLENEEQ